MSKKPTQIHLTPEDQLALRAYVEMGNRCRSLAERAQIILLAAEQRSTREIARLVGTRPARVSKWRRRFAQLGLSALEDADRSGRPAVYGSSLEQHIAELISQPPPAGMRAWTGPAIAQALGNVSPAHVWRVLRKNRHKLRECTGNSLWTQLVAFAGLYLSATRCVFVVLAREWPIAGPSGSGSDEREREACSGSALNAVKLARDLETASERLRTGLPAPTGTVLEFMEKTGLRDDAWRVHLFAWRGAGIGMFAAPHAYWSAEMNVWMAELDSWLTVLLGDQRQAIRRLIDAVQLYISACSLRPTAAFEWLPGNDG